MSLGNNGNNNGNDNGNNDGNNDGNDNGNNNETYYYSFDNLFLIYKRRGETLIFHELIIPSSLNLVDGGRVEKEEE